MTTAHTPGAAAAVKRKNTLYLQVLVAIALGIVVGVVWPEFGAALKPLGDAFVKLVRMLIAPIIFATVVAGLAGIEDLKKVGRVGLKALIYFEAVTTVALVIGLVVVDLMKPGAGIHATAATLDAKAVAGYATAAHGLSTVEFLLKIIPNTFVGAFVEGELLQVLLLAVLFGLALGGLGERGRPVVNLLNEITRVFFGIVGIVVRAAPLAAFGAMAFTIGKYGLHSLVSLASLMVCVYATCVVFVFGVLGAIARLAGFSLWRILN